MQSKTIWLFTILLVIATLFSVLTLASGTTLPENTNEKGLDASSSYVSSTSNDGRYILLKDTQFNTEEVPSASSMISMESTSPSASDGYYIVQFKGYVIDEWKQDVRDTGAIIFDYIPNNAFIVRMNSSVKGEVENLESVQWLGPYHASYRISPSLSSISEESGRVDVIVMLFDAGENQRVLTEIAELGGKIVDDAGDMVRVRIDNTKVPDIAAIEGVSWIELYVQPLILNDVAAGIINVSYVRDTHGLTGSGQIVAVADTGLDTGVDDSSMHDDLEGRIISIHSWWMEFGDSGGEDNNGHGTHVAGSVLGNGLLSNGLYAGMAPEAQLVFQSMQYDGSDPNLIDGGLYFPADLTLVFQEAYADGARIHSDSWGDGQNSAVYGNYTSKSRYVDSFMWDNPDFLIVFAAGNEAGTSGTCTPPGTAKNALTVGASENYRPEVGITADNIDDIASFSSRGPTDDGRIKPDVVAPGTYIISTSSSMPYASYEYGTINDYYANNSGTSMSAPLTAGTAALVRQYYVENESISPSAALLKATLVNGAVDIGKPTNAQGWGRVDLVRSLYPASPQKLHFHDNINLDQAESWDVSYYASDSSSPFKISLVWTDQPAATFVGKTLVNDLDLEVTGPDGTYLGNGGDHTNNVEQVELLTPSVGWYTITVNGTNVPKGPQPFALVLSGAFGNDTTAPSSITGLAGQAAETWVNWSWTNPSDPDFDHVEIYLNGVFQLNSSSASYNATDLTADTLYEIGTRTVDAVGNINNSWVNSSVSTTADTTAPSGITSLSAQTGETWINWGWTNPSDPDFDHVEIYLNGVFQLNSSSASYNATDLTADTLYEIGTRTVDAVGNINNSWVNSSVSTTADTTAPSGITSLSAQTGETWINWSWANPSDPDFDHVEIYLNGVFQLNSSSASYNATGLAVDAIYEIGTRTVDTVGNINKNWVNSTAKTSSQNGGGTSSSSSSSGGGGGGGGGSTTNEEFENIELKDVAVRYIKNNLETSFTFKNEGLDIVYIKISTDKTVGEIKAIVESLRSTSSLASKPPEGRVYKNINLWVGNAGLKNILMISDVGFRVDRTWLDENSISEYSVRLSTYRNGNWYVLPTERVDEDDNYVYYETDTSGELLSPFAIVEHIESEVVSLNTEDESVVEGSKVPEPVKVNPALDPSAKGIGITDGSGEGDLKGFELSILFFAVSVIILISVSFVAVRRGYHIKVREKAVGLFDTIFMEKDNSSRTSSDKKILHKDVPEGSMGNIFPGSGDRNKKS
ncbi:S8 family serine peptidase [Methanococcoides methylutens]|uniref:S8 family serine peptidase n=1 Tax=Methanococcoides methylutens TaxID=2226 RepID=UPI004044E6F6